MLNQIGMVFEHEAARYVTSLRRGSLLNDQHFSHYCINRTVLVVQEVLGAREQMTNERKRQ